MIVDKPALLLVEDSHQDAFLVEQCLRDISGGIKLDHVTGVNSAQGYLLDRCEQRSGTLPSCLMVDLALPDGCGDSLITWMEKDHRFKDIPVIVFSDDPNAAPDLDSLPNVACLIAKPAEIQGYDALAVALRPIIMSAVIATEVRAQS